MVEIICCDKCGKSLNTHSGLYFQAKYRYELCKDCYLKITIQLSNIAKKFKWTREHGQK